MAAMQFLAIEVAYGKGWLLLLLLPLMMSREKSTHKNENEHLKH